MEHVQNFQNYLIQNGSSRPTVKNYLADIRKFIKFVETTHNTSFTPAHITKDMVEAYKASLLAQNTSSSSIERYLSSMRKFATYLTEKNILPLNPFLLKEEKESDEWELGGFKNLLHTQQVSPLTVKNYFLDIKQFLSWIEKVDTNLSKDNKISSLTPSVIEAYKSRLLSQAELSPVSVNRKLSSIRKYLSYLHQAGYLHTLPHVANQQGEKPIQTISEDINTLFPSHTDEAKKKEDTQVTEDYSSFAPVRVSQKSKKGLSALFDVIVIFPLAALVSKGQLYLRKAQGKKGLFHSSEKKNFAFSKSLPKNEATEALHTFVTKDPKSLFKGVSNISKSFYAPLSLSTTDFPLHKKIWHHMRHTRPSWYHTYHSYPLTHYFHFAVLLIVIVVAGVGIYSALFDSGRKNPALAALPTAPPRILSFQGRLTDSSDNPITTYKNVRFAIYDDSSATGSGNLLWQELLGVTPDQDGVFSVLLGNTVTTCADPLTVATAACAIPSTLFTENATLYLGVTIENDTELTPRQQVATVAYATNAETLQGLPPSTAAGAATSNVVLALDSTGNLTIGGSATPTFQASGGQFTLSGSVLNLTTTAGSNSNVVLNPDGGGFIDVRKPFINSTLNTQLTTAAGAVMVGDLFAVNATSSGQSAFTLNQDGSGPLLSASVSGASKFLISNAGNVGIGTTTTTVPLTVAGTGGNIVSIVPGTGIATDNGYLSINSRARFGYDGAGILIDDGNTTKSFKITLGASDRFFIHGSTGNIGIGTTTTTSFKTEVAGSVGPSADATYDLGSATRRWNNLYVANIVGGTSGTQGFWQLSNGALAPYYLTNDLLLGATATSSAKFAFMNVAGGNPTASIAANLAISSPTGVNPSTTYTALNGGSINFRTSVGGDAGATSRLFITNNGNVGIGSTSPGQELDVAGDALVSGNVGIGTTTISDKLNINGNLRFTNATSNRIFYGTAGVAVPGASSAGEKIQLYGTAGTVGASDYALGIESGYMWLNSDGGFKWYTDSAETMRLDSAGNLGIGTTTTSTGKLSVGGNAYFSGNVGIGSTAPGAKLDISGGIGRQNSYTLAVAGEDNLLANGDFEQGGTYGWSGIDGTATGGAYSGNNYSIHTGSATVTSTDYIPVDPDYDVLQFEAFVQQTVAGTEGGNIYAGYMAYDESKVVITTSPCGTYCYFAASNYNIPEDGNWHKLSATTTGEGTSYPNFPVGTKYVRVMFIVNYQNTTGDAVTYIDKVSVKKVNNGPLFVGNNFSTTNLQDQFQVSKIYTTSSNNLILEPPTGGNVGIGTTSPLGKLNVVGTSAAPNGKAALVVIQNESGGDLFAASAAATTRFVVKNDGNVGLGTTLPARKLHLSETFDAAIRIGSTKNDTSWTADTDSVGILEFYGADASGGGAGVRSYIRNIVTAAAGNGNRLEFGVSSGNNAAATTVMSLLGGNVGIGSTSPTQVLDVVGNAALSGNLDAGGTLTAGTANAFVVNASGQITAATDETINGIDISSGAVSDITTLGTTGVVTFANYTTNGGLLYTNGSGVVSQTAAGSAGECLQSAGGGAPTWGSCIGGSGSKWTITNGAIHPNNSTLDLLLGGTGTASAKFGLINVNSGTPTATISGNLAIATPTGADPATTYSVFNGGSINFRTSVGGDGGATSRLFIANGGNVGIGTTLPTAKLEVNGTTTIGGAFAVSNGAASTFSGAVSLGNGNDNIDINGTDFYVDGTSGNVGIGTTTSLSDALTVNGNINLTTGNGYEIAGTSVLNATTLGSGVVTSSLTTVGALNSGSITSGFGSIDTGADNIITTGTIGSAGNTAFTGNTLTLSGQLTSTVSTGTSPFVVASTTLVSNLNADLLDGIDSTGFCQTDGTGCSTAQFWQRNSGALAPSNITDDVLLGATATSSALVRLGGTTNANSFFNTGGNVGIGSTSPSYPLDINAGASTSINLSDSTTALRIGGQVALGRSGNMTRINGTGIYFTANNSTSEHMRLDTNGNLGIGTTATTSKLQVNGGAAIGYSTSTSAPTNGLAVSGNVGIGTTTATEALEVNGDIKQQYSRNRTMSRTLPTTVNDAVDIGSFSLSNGAGSFWISITVPSSSFSTSKEYLVPIKYNHTANTWVTVLPTGSTGVYSSQDFDLEVNVSNATTQFRIRKTAGTTAGTAYIVIREDGLSTNSFTASTATSSVSAPTAYLNSTALTQVSGNVGIGTTSPSSRLDVNSSAVNTDVQRWMASDGSRLGRFTETSGGAGWFEVDNASGVAQALFRGDGGASYILSGNVGIGTSTPFGVLNVVGSSSSPIGKSALTVIQNESTDIFTASAGATTRFVIKNDGNVGIGTSLPTQALDITGSAVLSGNLGIGTTTVSSLLNIANSVGGIEIQGLSENAFNLYTEGGFIFRIDSDNDTTNTYAFYNGANTEIASLNESGNLQLDGNIDVDGTLTAGTADVFTINASGQISTTTDETINGVDISSGAISDVTTLSLSGQLTSTVSTGTAPFVVASTTLVSNLNADLLDGIDSTGFCQTDGTGCSTAQFWQRNSGALSPKNITDDVLLGATATSSALVKLPGLTNNDAIFNLGTGNVGIGTTTPTQKLVVNGVTEILQNMYVRGALGSTAEQIRIHNNNADTYFDYHGGNISFRDEGAGTATLFLEDSTGNIGIGTTSPFAKLNVIGDASVSASLVFGQSGTNTIDVLNGDTFNIANSVGGDTGLVTRLTLLSNGNIGISSTTPTSKLDVQGQITGGFGAQTTAGTLDWDDASNSKSGNGYSLLLGNATNGPGVGVYYHPFNFEYSSKNGGGNITQLAIPYGYTSGIDQGISMRGRFSGTWSSWVKILSENTAGNVGIGTTSSIASKVHVYGTTTGNSLVRFDQRTSGADIFTASASGTTRFVINYSGNVGIGTTLPGQELDVNGDILVAGGGTIDARAAGTLAIGGTTQTGLTLGRAGASTALVGNSSSSIDFGNFDVNATGEITAATNETINGIDISSGAVSDVTTLAASGVVTFSNYTTNGGLLYTNGSGVISQTTAGSAGQCLQSIGGGAPTWGTCGSGSNWTVGSGAIYPNNSTLDLFVGGSATTSAKFALINMNSGNPTASLSGNLAIASPTGANPATTYSAFNGGSINFRTSVGGDTGATSRLFITNNGNIGINSTSPTSGYIFDAVGRGRFSTGLSVGTTATTNTFELSGTLNQASGQVTFGGNVDANSGVDVAGADITAATGVQLDFADEVADKIYLWGTSYGMGISSGEANWWSGGSWSWRQSSRTGTEVMNLSSGGNLDIAGSLTAGTANAFVVNTSGVVTSGTWQGTAVGAQYGGTGINTSSSTGVPYISSGTWSVDANALAANHGGTGQTGYTTGDLLYASSTTALSKLGIGSTGQALTVSGGLPAWANTNTSAFGLWDQASGVINPKNSTLDLLVGGSATTSAKFGLINVNSGTPTATIAGNLAIAAPTGSNPATTYSALNGGSINFRTSVGGDTGATSRLYIENLGNVGVGTTTLDRKMSVAGDFIAGGTTTGLIMTGTTLVSGFYPGASVIDHDMTIRNGTLNGNLNFQTGGSTTRLSIDSSGILTASSYTTNGGLLYTNGSGVFSQTAAGSSGQCLQSNGGGAPTWVTCATGSKWTITAGGIHPNNSTLDLFIGGTATASSKFAFMNVNSGTPTFRAYNSSSSQYISLNHDGTNGNILASTGTINIGQGGGTLYLETDIQNDTTNNSGFVKISDKLLVQAGTEASANSLAIFDNTTAGADILTASSAGTTRFVLSGAGNVGIGTSLPRAALEVVGDASASGSLVLRNASSNQIESMNGSPLSFWTSVGGDAGLTERLRITSNGNVGINSTSPTSGYILDAVGRGRFSTGLSIGTTATTNVFELVGTMNQASGQVTLGGNVDATSGLDVTGSSLTVGGANFSVTTAGAITAAGDAAINGGDITTNQTTFNLVNATATSVNFAGGATGTLAIGNSSGTTNLFGANVRLGDTTNGINITSAGIITDLNGDVTVQDNLVPQANNTYDLGTASLQWQDYYGIGNAYSATFTDANNNSYYLDPASTTDSLLTLGSIRVGGGSSGTGGVTLEDNEQEGVAGTIPNGAGRNNLLATAGYVMSPFGGFGRYENYLRFSEQFNNQGYWARSGLSSVFADSAKGPNSQTTNLTTADIIADDGTPNGTLTQSYPGTFTASEQWTFSVWLRNINSDEDSSLASHTPATGNVILSLVSNGGSATAATTTITTPGTSWKRYSVTYAVNGSSPTHLQAQISYQGGANTAVAVWGAQLEKQAAPGVYVQTKEDIIETGRGVVAMGSGPHILQTGNGGTASPSASGLFLSASGGIQSTTVAPTKNLFELYNSDTSATNNVSSMGFLANRAGDIATQIASVSAILTDATATAYTGALSFSTMSQAGTTPTEKLRIAGNGNVGIGTSSPESLLEVQGASGADATLTLDADGGAQAADTWFIKSEAADNDLSFFNDASEVFKITSGGNLTMTGTTLTASNLATFTSAATLAFSGDIRVNGNDLLDSGGTSRIQLGSTITYGSVTTFTASSLTTFTTGATLAFSGDLRINGDDIQDSAGTTRLTLGATNTLTGDLNVTGQDIQLNGTQRISDSVSASYTNIRPQNNTLIVYNGSADQTFSVYNSAGSQAISLSYSGTSYGQITSGNHLVLNPTGNVGVNNTTPDRKFSVMTNVSGGSDASIINQTTTDSTGTGVLLLGFGVGTSGTNARWMKFFSACTDDTYSGCTGEGSISFNGSSNVVLNASSADYGEYFEMGEDVELGDIISQSNNKGIKANSSSKIIGVISNNSAIIGNSKGEGGAPGENYEIVGLMGQVPTKVSTINGTIRRGDNITASIIPGVGEKATRVGQIVGTALEDFDPNNPSQVISCPPGTEEGVICGKINLYINPSWFDPEVFITNAGDLNVSFENGQYVARNNGSLVSRIGSFATAVIANIRAGAIQAQTLAVSGASTFGSVTANSLSLATSNITIAGQSLTAFIDSRIQTAIDSGNFVTPLASDSATVKAGKIIVKAPVATEEPILEVQGNASISGQLATETLVTTDATVSGTLTVDTLIADNLTALEAQVASLSAGQTVAIATPSAESIASLISTGIQSNYADIASLSAGMAFVPDLKTDFLQVNQGLIALAPSSLSDTSITGQLSINGSLILSENSVNVLGADFNIQPLRQGGVSFQGGLITMDTEGNLYTAGNAAFAKDVTIGGKLATNFISPLPGNNLELTLPATATQLANGTGSSLVVKNASGSGILAINQLGDLVASGAGQFKELAASSLNIVRGAQADTSFNETVASGSAGTGSITAYYTERTITTPFVTEDSLIYITPTSNTSGITPYVSRQVAKDEENGIEGSFTVTIPQATTSDIKFNWWIVN